MSAMQNVPVRGDSSMASAIQQEIPQGLLLPPAAGGRLFPTCCGANGIAFSLSGGRLLVANTGFRNIIQYPGEHRRYRWHADDLRPTGINGPDGIAVKRTGTNAGSIWVTANQSDEIVIIDNVTGRVIDKFGDFFGLRVHPGCSARRRVCRMGSCSRQVWPSAATRGRCMWQTPRSRKARRHPASIDTAWAQRVTHWNVVRTTTTFNPPTFPNP